VNSSMLGDVDQWGKIIPSVPFERDLISALATYLRTLKNLEFETPIFVMISLLGVKGYTMAVDRSKLFTPYAQKIDRDSLILPDILVEDYNSEPARLLCPAFDAVWQSTGFGGSPNYDKMVTEKRSKTIATRQWQTRT
jgi:hypothetical protein